MLNIKKLLTKMIAVESGSLSIDTTAFTNHATSRNYYQRCGNVCTVGFDITPLATGSEISVCTLPSGNRPLHAVRIGIIPLTTGAGSGQNYIAIGTDGSVKMTFNSLTRIYQTLTFVCAGGVIHKILHAISHRREVAAC